MGSFVQYGIAIGILSAIGIVFPIVAIAGAIMYNVYMVGAKIVWLIVSFVLPIILDNEFSDSSSSYLRGNDGYLEIVYSAIVTVLLIYPHVKFVKEVKSGILTEETYPREYYS